MDAIIVKEPAGSAGNPARAGRARGLNRSSAGDEPDVVNQPPPEAPRQNAVAFQLAPLAGGRRRRIDPGWIVVGVVAALLVAAIVHPWQSSSPSIVVVPQSSNLTVDTPDPSFGPAPSATPGQSAADVLATEVYDLGIAAGPWGVGVGAAVGPPLQPNLEIPALGVATDQAWWAWIVVHPSPAGPAAGSAADAIETLPVSKLCSGVPDLPTGAQVLVVTTPSGTPDVVQLVAWHDVGWHDVGWHDEPRDIEPLSGLVSAVVRRTGDVSYLLLANGHAWPDGRYELHVDGASGTSLSVCLGRP